MEKQDNSSSDKVLPKEQVVSELQTIIDQSIQELEYDLIPNLRHGEAKRLLVAVLKYPKEVADFSNDRVELIHAYSASKALQDALVGMGVEVTIDRMIKAQMEETSSEGVSND